MTLQEQREDLDRASRFLENKIHEMQDQRQVLINAFNSIGENHENMIKSESILAQETRKIMCELKYF